ncbi:DUF5954 family protein [Streptomyces sp. V4-01]|uniref:DUF5954 family protein n=1 Tax=Actinacidiphila polyblastidii TaxID=3110430 RepID=A0ABU7PCH5_9ACTN|nr:DUF5954 family protein [Streptomyces sp. V4-01]
MNPSTDDDPSHRTGRLTAAEEEPLTALADIEAWKARKHYPSTLFAGGPVFGAAHERPDGGWELHPYFAGLAPQDARDGLAAHLRLLARSATDRGDDGAAAEYLAAAGRLDREPLDAIRVGAERFRVVRAERFIRMGPDGPEPPRRSDPDAGAGHRGSGDLHASDDPAAGLVIHPAEATQDGAAGVLRVELLAALRKKGTVPREVHEDSRLAAGSHPGGVLLPATFMAAEREGGRWRPHSTGTAATPGDARDGLALHLRVMVPWQQDLTVAEREVYKRAADRLDEQHCDELAVAGRHFRIVRVERLVRVGPEGPEGPRPSDADPVPPPLAHDPAAPDEDDSPPPEPDERTRRFLALFEEERTRRTRL